MKQLNIKHVKQERNFVGCVTLLFDKALIHLNFNSSECDEKVKHPCNKVTGTGDFTSL